MITKQDKEIPEDFLARVIDESLNSARCAQVNLDNLIKGNPVIGAYPMYIVARLNLNSCVDKLESSYGR